MMKLNSHEKEQKEQKVIGFFLKDFFATLAPFCGDEGIRS
jgi:hypothetical protein